MTTIDLHLSKAQLNKLKKQKPFQMTKSQIEKGGCDKTCHCKLELTESQMKNLLRNLKTGKGFRFKDEHIMGSGWWDSVKSGFQTVKNHVENAGRFIKDNIDEDTAKTILKTAVDVGTKLSGREDLKDKINSGVEKGVKYGYETKKKSLKDHAKDLSQVYEPELTEVKDIVKTKAKQEFDKRFNKQDEEPTAEGEGFKKSKKGSAEMKERMAKLRAMRVKRGGNIWSDMASGLIHVGIPAVSGVIGDVLGGPAGGVAGAVAGNMGANAIGNATGYGFPERIMNPSSTRIGGIEVPFRKSDRVSKHKNVTVGGSFLAI